MFLEAPYLALWFTHPCPPPPPYHPLFFFMPHLLCAYFLHLPYLIYFPPLVRLSVPPMLSLLCSTSSALPFLFSLSLSVSLSLSLSFDFSLSLSLSIYMYRLSLAPCSFRTLPKCPHGSERHGLQPGHARSARVSFPFLFSFNKLSICSVSCMILSHLLFKFYYIKMRNFRGTVGVDGEPSWPVISTTWKAMFVLSIGPSYICIPMAPLSLYMFSVFF